MVIGWLQSKRIIQFGFWASKNTYEKGFVLDDNRLKTWWRRIFKGFEKEFIDIHSSKGLLQTSLEIYATRYGYDPNRIFLLIFKKYKTRYIIRFHGETAIYEQFIIELGRRKEFMGLTICRENHPTLKEAKVAKIILMKN